MTLLIELNDEKIVNMYTFLDQKEAELFMQNEKYKAAVPELEWEKSMFSVYSIKNGETILVLMDARMFSLNMFIADGRFETDISCDVNYPGVDTQFIPDESISDNVLSFPRVLIEKPVDSRLQAMIWGDAEQEDYTQKFSFDNI